MSSNPNGNGLLIAAHAARYLAASARRSGRSSQVIDAFGDMDTLAQARDYRRVPLIDGCFDPLALATAARQLADASGATEVLWGAGLEAMPDASAELSDRFTYLGNPLEVVRQVREPEQLFPLLKRLAIPYPTTRTAPLADTGWLVKHAGGTGGGHVHWYRPGMVVRPREYFQRYVIGQSVSVTFLADGEHTLIFGFNTQWTAGAFTYAGAVNTAALPNDQRQDISQAIARLVRATGLRGLNSADLICNDNDWWLLEINPRPSATAELYEPAAEVGMVALHIEACRGRLPRLSINSGNPVGGHAIVHAPSRLTIPSDPYWPVWTTDRPCAGAVVEAGAPLCSVHAHGASALKTRQRLAARRDRIIQDLTHQQQAA